MRIAYALVAVAVFAGIAGAARADAATLTPDASVEQAAARDLRVWTRDGAIVMSTGKETHLLGQGTHPAAAWNGTFYLVTWTMNDTVVGARVDTSGVALDRPFRISAITSPARDARTMIIEDDGGFVVRWNSDTALINANGMLVESL